MPQRTVIFKAQYRVLVLKPQAPTGLHAQVLAICLERNLVGRGATVPEALKDLGATVSDDLNHEWGERLPAPKADPEPELVALFESEAPTSADGEVVLQRLYLQWEARLVSPQSRPTKGRPHGREAVTPAITFQSAIA